MKKLFAVILLTATILCAGCGGDKKLADNGKTTVIDLPEGEKLVNFAGDHNYKYIVRRKRRTDEKPEDYMIDRINSDGWGGYEQTDEYFIVREH